ncbi:lipoate--protein ligase [Lactococcus formosensis]|uniref:lipoate--protein ligase n=1 Tax=Lactococcus formosensis TaxID=1281486 RepID=A0A9X4NZJ8_9LACT|nr:lipoate--protein ligase [Lactococcus formosensis]MCO7180011.1 lipoate--protein ligase [Lactococcus formosensis]MDG6132620.1 lipoate--protein ligase [Lactococcus formosensis]MDG6134615.1 lipoate--protein ligase [Lactococcus formosensis]MDG6138343.1 lipoate--protein ligase [Lactococcus formosensis]MDG6139761.1 lipoate--protein ligase [Lactococcus formosensis]
MQYINYLGQDAYTNIAMDSWLLNNLKADEPVFSLWQNKRAVIVGRNQNTFAEINQDYIDQHDVQVVRRVSGGGAVYHDEGNICFTFFVPVASSAQVNFHQFVKPMYDALRSLGIEAEITGRNDLEISGKKVSGNAQRYAGGYLMHHGTLLWDTDVEAMIRSLNVSDEKFVSKAAKSVRARVGNIKDFAPDLNLDTFIDALKYYLTDQGKDGEYVLNDEQLAGIKAARDEQFSTWDWNYGESPKFSFNNHAKFTGGSIDIQVDVDNGLITDINFLGDFLGVRDWRDIKQDFIGLPFNPDAVYDVLEKNKAGQYFGTIENNELSQLFRADELV